MKGGTVLASSADQAGFDRWEIQGFMMGPPVSATLSPEIILLLDQNSHRTAHSKILVNTAAMAMSMQTTQMRTFQSPTVARPAQALKVSTFAAGYHTGTLSMRTYAWYLKPLSGSRAM